MCVCVCVCTPQRERKKEIYFLNHFEQEKENKWIDNNYT